jgi:hypothetical protein
LDGKVTIFDDHFRSGLLVGMLATIVIYLIVNWFWGSFE